MDICKKRGHKKINDDPMSLPRRCNRNAFVSNRNAFVSKRTAFAIFQRIIEKSPKVKRAFCYNVFGICVL